MTPVFRRSAPALAGLAWLGAFSVLYTLGDGIGAWPKLPPGAFANLDLSAGLVAGLLLLAVLLLPDPRHRTRETGSSGRDLG